jgi:hypothetical protein
LLTTDGSVDGLPLAAHLDVLQRLRGVLTAEFGGPG